MRNMKYMDNSFYCLQPVFIAYNLAGLEVIMNNNVANA